MAKASPFKLPPPKFGVDILSQEGSLPPGTVRRAHNVVIDNVGQFDRRPGYSKVIDLPSAHSFWRNAYRTLVVSGDTLYTVNFSSLSVTPLFSGLPLHVSVSYTEVGTDTYFAAPGFLGKITAEGLVRRPGIANMVGIRPTLTATVGNLTPGKYGVAYSLLNDLGEESGLSSVNWIDLPTGGGVLLSVLQNASHVTQVSLYLTTPDGEDLYLYGTASVASTLSIGGPPTKRRATKEYLDPMPGGDIVRYFNGRLYLADGPWLWISEPLDYGLFDARGGYMTFGESITMLEPVDDGVYVGFVDKTLFLRGEGPGKFVQVDTSQRGAVLHSGSSVLADFFDPNLVPDRGKPVAVWLSEAGVAIGRQNGAVAYPQALRVNVLSDRARVLFARRNGYAQGIFCGATTGTGAVDRTT
jgi:hypothetical protein